MNARDRPEERFAFAVVAARLAGAVTRYDDGSVPGMVDGLVALSDGRTAAVEVTSIGDPASFRSEAELARRFPPGFTVAGLEWAWVVLVPATVNPMELVYPPT